MDMAEKRGIEIDLNTLESIMQVPVVGTVAIKGEGIDKLIMRIEEKKVGNIEELVNGCRGKG